MHASTPDLEDLLRSRFRDPQRPRLDNRMILFNPNPILLRQLVHTDVLQESAKRLIKITEHRIARRHSDHLRAAHHRTARYHGHECHRRKGYEFLH